MSGFEPQTSGVGSDRFVNLATTTALKDFLLARCLSIYYPSSHE